MSDSNNLTERIQAEARNERELSEALLHYYTTRQRVVDGRRTVAWLAGLLEQRVWDAEAACNVQRHDWQGCRHFDTSLGNLANEGLLGVLARDVLSIGALRAYERLRANYLDNDEPSL